MTLDEPVARILDIYEAQIDAERHTPRQVVAPGERDPRMRAIGRETGQLLRIMAASLPTPTILELGTSYGYSTLWLALAARATGGRVITMEYHDYKSEYARRMAERAGLAEYIDFRVGDACHMIGELDARLDFVFVDLWKDLYVPCLDAFYPRLNDGAIVAADNIIRPETDSVRKYQRAIRARPGMSSVLLPVGSGVEVSRYQPEAG